MRIAIASNFAALAELVGTLHDWWRTPAADRESFDENYIRDLLSVLARRIEMCADAISGDDGLAAVEYALDTAATTRPTFAEPSRSEDVTRLRALAGSLQASPEINRALFEDLYWAIDVVEMAGTGRSE